MQVFLQLFLLTIVLSFSSGLMAEQAERKDSSLRLDKDGIKVFIYNQKNSPFSTFKATSHIEASLDSILAVMFDIYTKKDNKKR